MFRWIVVIAILFFLAACSGTPDRRDTKTYLKDKNIESKATNDLYGDTHINKKIHVNVTSFNGVTLVSGEVLSEALRQQVIEIVRNIPDVRRVHNELVVADLTNFESRSRDSWLTSKVKSQLAKNKQLAAKHVKVVTENETVYLLGLVTENEGQIAADVARNVTGVKSVITLFEYIPEPPATPAPAKS